jgi:hypothetical protein
MAKMGKEHGSAYHLRCYLDNAPAKFSEAVQRSIQQAKDVEWIQADGNKEWKGMRFLRDPVLEGKWEKFWPQRGNPPNWDAVGRLNMGDSSGWLLLEAKANHPEFCSPPTGAVGLSKDTIRKALGRTKNHLGVHRDFPWLGTYYQYANRLACLYFLNIIANVPTRLIFVYFTGDRFPDSRRCPQTEAEWHGLIEACHSTLGLPQKHALSGRIHEVFLPAFGKDMVSDVDLRRG